MFPPRQFCFCNFYKGKGGTMKLTVYRQSSKQRPDGQVVYKGEDARPYVGDNVLLVADGMGGAAAIRHQKFNRDLFDEEKLMTVLFDGIPGYESEVLAGNEEYRKYIIDSFFEFMSIKDCYFDNVYNIKKSGYFASRIVAAIFLHDILFDSRAERPFWGLKSGEIFNRYNQTENKQEFLDNISKYVTDKVKYELKKIAQNANLIYESSYSGLALLGTTLCATVFYERENCVEALYFVAGDSRPYMWNESGLFQIVEDQEGQDGGMTNYIKANEDGDFRVECKYAKFDKPCMLFNASDGCFDSKYFVSQLAFEKLILETIIAENDLSAVASSLENTFTEYGRHDDSSTIAMKFFGYDNYEAVKAAAEKRMADLRQKYFDVLPNLLEEDYSAKLEEQSKTCPDTLKQLKNDLESLNAVKEYCFDLMKRGQFEAYSTRVAQLDAKLAEYNRQLNHEYAELENLVGRNYSAFASLPKLGDAFGSGDFESIKSYKRLYRETATKYKYSIDEKKKELESVTALLIAEAEKISEADLFDEGAFENIDWKRISECRADIIDVQKFFKYVKWNRSETIKKLDGYRSAFYDKNLKLAKNNQSVVKKIIEMLLDGTIDIAEVDVWDVDKNLIKESLNKIFNVIDLSHALDIDERNKVLAEVYPAFWSCNYLSVMKSAVEKHFPDIGEEPELKVREYLQFLENELATTERLSQKQKELFDDYDLNYYSLIRG